MSEQPNPVPNNRPAAWDLVIADMHARDRTGQQRYGVRLQPFNGRDALRDLYEELLDAVVYCRQLMYELSRESNMSPSDLLGHITKRPTVTAWPIESKAVITLLEGGAITHGPPQVFIDSQGNTHEYVVLTPTAAGINMQGTKPAP